MILAQRLPLLPPDAQQVSESLAIQQDDERIVFFNAAGPIYSCVKDDHMGVRLGAQTMLQQDLAGVNEIARALDIHRTTIFRDGRRLEGEGIAGLAGKRRGPKGPRLLPPAVLRDAQDLLDRGASMRATAAEVGVSEGTIRNAVKQGRLTRESTVPRPAPAPEPELDLRSPGARAAEDQACEPGVAVKRNLDRALARMGMLPEAPPEFQAVEAVPGAGVLLALPALMYEGLLEVGQKVYGRLQSGFFGLRSILLTFAFMALLRIRTPEQITGHAPGELGMLIGLDRAPEVKTLRRKLSELGDRGRARTFAKNLTERWVAAAPEELGVLYIDGHVRPYNGRTHTLPKLHVQQRGRPMPGTKDFHVNDRRFDPVFFVTAPATEGMLDMLDSTILPEIRRLVGPDRRVTLSFDREGWSPERFATWKGMGFDVLTYRKGKQSRWQERFFEEMTGTVDGRTVTYRLSEREVNLSNGLKVREIRRLTDTGHQTAIITTDEDRPTLEAAHTMFGRWGQENFFRYMEQEFDLNHLCTNAVEPADPDRLVTSPERKALEKKRSVARAARTRLIDKRLDLAPDKKVRVGKRYLDEEQIDAEILKHEAKIERLTASIVDLPKKVPIHTLLEPEKIVMLERERKVIVDLIKLTAYRAESALTRFLDPLLARHAEEGRRFLQSVFKATADMLPDVEAGRLTVRFHGLATPRATHALAGLCACVSQKAVCYPGTNLRLHFEVAGLQK